MEHITCTLNLSLAVICEKNTFDEGFILRNWLTLNSEIDLVLVTRQIQAFDH